MALHIPKAPSIPQMLKDGVRYFSRLEEAIYRNTSACKQFAQSVRTTYGPNGINKMVINHLEKLFVTSEAATIIKQLDIEHPAVKLSVLASEVQEAEVGGGRNFVIIFAGALLEVVEEDLRLDIAKPLTESLSLNQMTQGGGVPSRDAGYILQSDVVATQTNSRNDIDISCQARQLVMEDYK